MSYDHQKDQLTGVTAASQVVVTTSTGVVSRFFPGLRKMKVRRIGVTVIAAPGTTPPVLAFKHRPTPGSASGEVTIDTITVPLAAAVGSVYYVDGLDYVVPPGDEIVVDVTTNSTSTGTVVPHIEADPVWEVEPNNSNMVLSA